MTCTRHPDGDGPAWCMNCHPELYAEKYGVEVDKIAGRAAGRVLRNEAVSRVQRNNPTVYDQLVEIGPAVCQRMFEVIGDDIHDEADKYDIKIREPRVLGPVMNRLCRDGWLVPTERRKFGHRPENHLRPQRVWESAVYAFVMAKLEPQQNVMQESLL